MHWGILMLSLSMATRSIAGKIINKAGAWVFLYLLLKSCLKIIIWGGGKNCGTIRIILESTLLCNGLNTR